jgi:hypothetical protein
VAIRITAVAAACSVQPGVIQTGFSWGPVVCHGGGYQVLDLEDGILGSVMTIQTFGDYAKWHPHIHSITADGLIRESGVFHDRRIPSPTWRECIKKIWEVDPLECPRCHAEMKIISFINEPQVIEKILRHLDLDKIALA